MEIDGNTLIFIIIILFLFFSSPGGDGVSSQYEYNQLQTLKSIYQNEFDTFKNLTSTTNFRNITGLKLSYEDVQGNPDLNATYPLKGKVYDHWFTNQTFQLLPDEVMNMINTDIWNLPYNSKNLFPPNITSTVMGSIKLHSNNKYEKINMPVPRFYEPPKDFSDNTPPWGETYVTEWPSYGELHNVTFDSGELNIQISHIDKVTRQINSNKKYKFNKEDENWKLLSLKIDFFDKAENEKHSINSLAIYDIRRGRILSMTQSAKFHSIFALPHYLNFENNDENNNDTELIFNESKQLLIDYWNASNYIDTLTMGNLEGAYDNAYFKCEFMTFLQLEPWNQYTKEQLKLVNEELNWPLGRPANLSVVPPVKITKGLLYSPDCGVLLNMENVKGPRYELKLRTIRTHLLAGVVLIATEIYLLLRQMQHTNTPSSVNKISFYCFSMMNLVDGSLATLYFIASSVIPELYLPLVISAFASFILASIFETRYLISIYASQINEQYVGVLTLLRGSTAENDEERPVVIPDEASISSSLYGRFFFMLIIFTFLILSSTSWPRQIRMIFEYSAIFILNSYWIPQIFRNAVKGIPSRRRRRRDSNTVMTRRQNKTPLLWKFIIGTTIIRALPVIYVFTYSSNVFRHHKDVRFAVLLSLWLLFQITMLYTQDILGSRWFLPRHAIPEGYSYFKAISSQHLMEHGQTSEVNTVDCSICMSEIPVYVEELPETHKVDQHSYMVTPCNHIFHTSCLENWMSYKLQCPVCRAPLPPL
ncbi:hypothetical protein KAFR_0B01460 [Kazachstania africana CBS 2517]|uniref:RING-type E3 ubiquitin transferase n=1 Tax=Kazachstania africana (strain ATCC 22294 / BCRC 22015 / CBS 2517 / CECT 1963 / NBRC 1671 / NRRL Y-8276) TaxID=1071382 RepID=H2APZ5_KAZAF|nr:hypothetical protein KAFR_0B01460 [Kazachstania africana CBS 2517]CCF56445.1 hypothetical protein KAFR_0B01460 [Kazachstania africana CBS 2517]